MANPTQKPRRIFLAYFALFAGLAALAVFASVVGGSLGASLEDLLLGAMLVGMIGWLVVVYFASGGPGTYLRPDTDKMTLLTGDPSLVMVQESPEVMTDAGEKISGSGSNLMLFAGANALACLVIGILFVFIPWAATLGLVAVASVIGAVYRFETVHARK